MEEFVSEEVLNRFEECYKALNYRRTGKDLGFLFDWVENFCDLHNIPHGIRTEWHEYAHSLVNIEITRADLLGLWECINEEGETRWTDEIRE